MSKIVVEDLSIIKKTDLGRDNYVMVLAPFSRINAVRPGQFVHVKIPGTDVFFRRAFSVYDVNPGEKSIRIIFKVFGRGTRLLAGLRKGDSLSVLGPLGNGFDFPSKRETVILAAGGIGMPPLYLLAKKLLEKGFDKTKLLFFYGGASGADLVDLKRIKRLGLRLLPATEDGSLGFKGVVTDVIRDQIRGIDGKFRIYACGPEGMLAAVNKLAGELRMPGQLSLEAPMPCGIGVCLGCIRPLAAGGYTRVCREGPVYDIGEVLL
jgi:dihydroorotate dehydrogenase electron transfer subunit